MNGTPRGFNRFMLGLIGLILLALGIGVVMLATVPSFASWWQSYSAEQLVQLQKLASQTQLANGYGSWVWLIVAAVLLLVVILMVSWIGNQGRGRSTVLFDERNHNLQAGEDNSGPGKVVLGNSVAEHTLRAALLERGDLLSVSVTSFDFQGNTSLRVRVLPRQGVPPHHLAAEIVELVDALEILLGVETPVLLSVGSGARSRFTKAERVR